MVSPMAAPTNFRPDDYVRVVVDTLQQHGNELPMTRLSNIVRWGQPFTPTHSMKLRPFLLDYPHLFEIGDDQIVSLKGASLPVPRGRSTSRVRGGRSLSRTRVMHTSSHATLPMARPLTAPTVGLLCQPELVDDPGVALERAEDLCQLQAGVVVALDLEGLHLDDGPCLMQVAFDAGEGLRCYVFDLVALGRHGTFPRGLAQFLQSSRIIKYIHDLRMDAAALWRHRVQLNGAFDTQLAYEWAKGAVFGGLNHVLELCGVPTHETKSRVHKMMDNDPQLWQHRPLPAELLHYAAQDVCLLHAAVPKLWEELARLSLTPTDRITRASARRAQQARELGEKRRIVFDSRHSNRMASQELLEEVLGERMWQMLPKQVGIQDDTPALVNLLPGIFRAKLRGYSPNLRDIVLDLGMPPRAFFGDKLVYLCDDPCETVRQEDLTYAIRQLGGEQRFGPDNRAGIDGSLHRISAMRWNTGDIYGLTLRAGRSVTGNTNLITDLLLAQELPSILVLGLPGSGKTTIIREAARILSIEEGRERSVVVVDTSKEICGDGKVVHRSVGLARRMVLPEMGMQTKVMLEALQNHTPDVIIVDEIGRREEAEACQTVKARGVQLIASGHGDLPGLVKNNMLNLLVGGVETVTVGDAMARTQQQQMGVFSKVRTQRAGPPVFDVVLELQPGRFHEWRVVKDVAKAVDDILAGQPYRFERRSRDPDRNEVYVSLERSQQRCLGR